MGRLFVQSFFWGNSLKWWDEGDVATKLTTHRRVPCRSQEPRTSSWSGVHRGCICSVGEWLWADVFICIRWSVWFLMSIVTPFEDIYLSAGCHHWLFDARPAMYDCWVASISFRTHRYCVDESFYTSRPQPSISRAIGLLTQATLYVIILYIPITQTISWNL